ncbi:MAG TPA: glycosyltransferase 87 family protein, partial [Candidatus Eremiobacteraceae bacterium]|nr:glycosyltransferase 87 family protein [Candidatus Eremiobacteraceae bacterium]
MKRLPPLAAAIAVALGVALALALAVVFVARHGGVSAAFARTHSGGDFVAFYCAGKIALSGADPYRVEPLRTCEHSLDSLGAAASASDVTPAPLPGYSLALFGLLARLPYPIALGAWYLVLLASLFVSAWTLTRITRLPWYVVLAALAVPFAYVNFVFAQLPPLAVAALCVAAYCVHERRFAFAGVAAACSMVEPHIGLPACAAMFVFLPACRLALAASGGALAVASLAVLGVQGNVEYFTRALPLHALAEAGASDQLSFTWLLHWFGAGDRVAVIAGSASYVVLSVLGIFLARGIARAYASDYFLVLLPPAVAMLGGAFVHNLQYAAVIPGALALAAVMDSAAAWTAVAILAMPWQGTWHSKLYFLVASCALGIIAWHASSRIALSRRVAVVAGAVVAFAVVTFGIASLPAAPVVTASPPQAFFDSLGSGQDLASAVWGVRMRTEAQYAESSLQTLAQKLPPWTGIILLIGVAASALAARRRVARASPAVDRPARLPASVGVLVALVAVNVCIALTLSALLNMDTDESYTMHTTSGSAHYALTESLRFEFQPPLYFVGMWAWRQLNDSVFFGRLFSVLCIAVTIVLVWALSKRIAPATNPAWLTSAVALNPFVIWCAVEMRVYALVMLLSTLLLLTFFDGFVAPVRSRGAQVGFALTAIVGLYSFYFIGFLLVGFGAALLALRRWRALGAFAVVGAAIALAFAPLAAAVGRQASASVSDFGERFSFVDALAILAKVLALAAMPIRWAQWHGLWLIFLVALAIFAVHVIRSMAAAWPPRATPQLAATACAVAVASIAFAAALTYTQQPLANRYVAFLFVPLMAAGYAAFSAFDNYVRRALAAVALGVALLAGGVSLLYEYGPIAKTGDWSRVASYLMHQEQPDQPILVFEAEAAVPLTYYYRGTNQLVPVPRALDMQTYDLHALALTSERDVAAALARVPGPHRFIWVVTTDYCSTGALDFHCPVFESYLAKHYAVVRQLGF